MTMKAIDLTVDRSTDELKRVRSQPVAENEKTHVHRPKAVK